MKDNETSEQYARRRAKEWREANPDCAEICVGWSLSLNRPLLLDGSGSFEIVVGDK